MSSGSIVTYALITAVLGVGAVALTSERDEGDSALDSVKEVVEDIVDALGDAFDR